MWIKEIEINIYFYNILLLTTVSALNKYHSNHIGRQFATPPAPVCHNITTLLPHYCHNITTLLPHYCHTLLVSHHISLVGEL